MLFTAGVLLAPVARADEVQVPLDDQGTVEQLDGDRARSAGVLSEFPNLEEARLYQDGDRFTLEVTELKNAQRVRLRVPLTTDKVAQLRRQISARLGTGSLSAPPPPPSFDAPPTAPSASTPAAAPMASAPAKAATPAVPERGVSINQEGRWLLIGTSTALGLGFYGWSIPLGLQLTGAGMIGGYMVVAGASFFVPFLLTSNTEVTWGTTNMFYAGATRGPIHAALLLGALNALNSQTVFVGIAGAGIAEAIAGALWASAQHLSAGQAHTIASANDFGLGFGLALGVLATGGISTPTQQVVSTTALIGAVAGTIGGVYLAHVRDYTWGDAEAVASAGLLGAYCALPFIAFNEFKDARLGAGLMLVGAGAGLLIGDQLVHGKHYSVGQGMIVDFAALAGGLVGYGVMLGIGSGTDAKAAFTASAVGALGGYALAYFSAGRGPLEVAGVKMNLSVDPTALTRRDSNPNRSPAVALNGIF